MFDQIGRLAEQTASSLSRRRFLTNLGRGGLALGAFLVGDVAFGKKPPPPPPPPRISCVLNGGCCGGTTPYLATFIGPSGATQQACSSDPACGVLYLCGASSSCHGGGSCQFGQTLYSDSFCNTPCV